MIADLGVMRCRVGIGSADDGCLLPTLSGAIPDVGRAPIAEVGESSDDPRARFSGFAELLAGVSRSAVPLRPGCRSIEVRKPLTADSARVRCTLDSVHTDLAAARSEEFRTAGHDQHPAPKQIPDRQRLCPSNSSAYGRGEIPTKVKGQ